MDEHLQSHKARRAGAARTDAVPHPGLGVGDFAIGAPLFKGYPELLTVKHLHELTGLSEQTLRAEINAGKLPGCRIGRRLYVPKSQFIAYIEKGI